MSRRELILYATPAGELGVACDRYYRAAAAIGPTTAQARRTAPSPASSTGHPGAPTR
jgi:hypothetical protein